MEHPSRKMKNVLTISAFSVISLTIFIVALLYFPLEFISLSIVAIFFILRSIEKEIDEMEHSRIETITRK